MGPFYTILFSIFGRRRVCPQCNRGQLVKPEKKRETVRCRFCKAKIPPAKDRKIG